MNFNLKRAGEHLITLFIRTIR